MSRTKKRAGGTTNPVQKTITYKPNSGEFTIYDKASKKRSTTDSISIIVLDADRNSITGYSPEHESPILCNTVLNTKKEKLILGVIKNGKYVKVVEGFYQDIKEELEGSKYTSNVFCLLVEDGKTSIADLQLVGQARGQFSDWYTKNEVEVLDNVVTLTASEGVFNYVKKTGELEEVPKAQQNKWRTTWLKTLITSLTELSDEDSEQAEQADKDLQKYLVGEGASTSSSDDDDESDDGDEPDGGSPTAPEDAEAGEKSDLPF